jgi:uncharacterized protein (TIGR02996 family)
MRPDADGFLTDILARPDDDGPRLIYADYLDETGDRPRAEFIRTQLALADLPDTDRRRPALVRTEQLLLAAHRDRWAGPLDGLATAPVFRRGFVEEVNVTARRFLAGADRLFALAPIRHVHLLDIGGHLDAVFASPLLARLTGLSVFAQHKGEPLARAVADCHHLAGLTRLHLGRNEIRCDGVLRLAASPHLRNLEDLDLTSNEIDAAGAAHLAERAEWPNLRRLELAQNGIPADGAERVAGAPHLVRLAHLGLAGNRVWTYQRDQQCEPTRLLRVPSLDLSYNGLTSHGLRVLLQWTGAAGVRELDLTGNHLGDEGARRLATTAALAGLRVLKLTNNGIGDDGLRALSVSPHLTRLTTLDVSNNPVGDEGVRALVESAHLTALRHLSYPTLGLSFRLRLALHERYADPT